MNAIPAWMPHYGHSYMLRIALLRLFPGGHIRVHPFYSWKLLPMPPSHKSPKQFMDYVRQICANPMTAILSQQPNKDFLQIYETRLEDLTENQGHNETLRKLVTRMKQGDVQSFSDALSFSHDAIVNDLWNSVKEVFDTDIRNKMDATIAVGALDSISVNAFCAKSPEGYIAVLINSGLITLLNKLSKINTAAAMPGSIVYCNRAAPSDITPELLKKWRLEVCEHYHQTGKPLGPQIHLSTDAMVHHVNELHCWEQYIMCHEVGHILRGHLDDRSFMSGILPGLVEVLEEDTNYVMETEADRVGYEILRRCYPGHLGMSFDDQQDDRVILSHLVTLFDMLFMLGTAESKTHPHPIDRLCNIVSAVYGDSVAEMLAASYEDNSVLERLFANPLIAVPR